MAKFTDNLWQDLVREHSATLVHAERPEGRVNRARRTVIGGSTLGIAGIGAAAVLVLGGSSAPPAFAITTNDNGATVVHLSQKHAIPQVNAQLASQGEAITVQTASGPATTPGAVNCVPVASFSGTPVKVLVGTDGTEAIAAGNTGAGSWHVAACALGSADSGNSGPGFAGTGNSGSGSADTSDRAVVKVVRSNGDVATVTAQGGTAVLAGNSGS